MTGSPGREPPSAVRASVSSRQVERQVLGSPRDDGQAHAVHGDRGADVAVGRRRCGSRPPAGRSGLEHGPALLNDPGEHRPPPVGPSPIRSTADDRAARRASAIGANPSPTSTPGAADAADQLRGEVQHDPVDEVVADEAPRERRAAFEQHALHVALAQVRQQRRQRHAARRRPVEGRRPRRRALPTHRRARRRRAPWSRQASAPSASKSAPPGGTRPARRRRRAAAGARRGTTGRGPSARGRRRAPCRRPTTIASAHARRTCASSRASSPVIHRDVPSARGRPAVQRRGRLQLTNGRPVRTWRSNAAFSRRASASRTPVSTSTPACAQPAKPRPSTTRVRIAGGDDDPSDAGVDDRARARRRAAEVVAGLERAHDGGAAGAVARRAQRHDLGVRRPRDPRANPRRRRPRRARRRRRPSGWGTRGPIRAPRAPAHAACAARAPRVLRRLRHPRPFHRGEVGTTRGAAPRDARNRAPSPPIPTLTVGPGISPGPPSRGSRGVADCHRRWGITPRPGNELPWQVYGDLAGRSRRIEALRRRGGRPRS